ncbi:T1SS secreted agglutinin RTX [Vibrio maritimus]|uniref:T1SS secreted agglutinin RTX n=1 Tax=Vibrio maritimus TaxID=990268 RepID=A0A090TX85_9VIBR|nr:T1SS secreted agglutinin RTX [Vibrio maritimus]
MSTISLASLVQVSGTLIVDAQGKLTVLPEGTAPRPGDVVIDILQDAEVGDELSIELIQADGQGQEITIEDADAEAIIAAIEQGDDPTENEEQATAAGEDSGSSPIAIGSIARAGAQTIAATSFDTSGLQAQGLTSTQSLTLLEFLANSDPTITSEELVGFAIEAGSNQDGSDFEGVSSLSGQLTAADLEFPSESLVWNLLSQPDNLDDYGTFTFQPDGQWTFVLNNDSSLVQALNVEDVVP